jgi:hypothetical protein
VKTVYLPQPNQSDPLKRILSGVEEKPTLSVLMKTPLLSGLLQGEGEISDSRSSGPGTQSSGTDMQYRLLRFGLSGGLTAFKYGASYRVAGGGYVMSQDQAIREVWGEWNIGMIHVKTALTERWDNIDKDPHRIRLTGAQGKTTMAIAPPRWPELMISYARDASWSSLEPSGVAPQRHLIDTVEAALSYVKPTWTARLLSAYAFDSDQLRVTGETVGLTHAISGFYRTTNRLTIAPTMSLRTDQQRWSGVRLETPSASLAVTYAHSPAFNLTAIGSFSQTRSSDGLVDNSTSKMSSVASWTYFKTPRLRTILSVDASYTTLLDAIQSARSTEDLSGLLRVQLAGL